MSSLATARWRQVLEIVDHALDLTHERRSAYLDDVSAGDPTLGAHAASILRDADVPTFLNHAATDFAAPILEATAAVPTNEQVGPYRIIREIGRGGMGSVYLATRADNQFQRTVALKLLPRWSATNERAVRRFLEERQILAALAHPDIARLFDGGVTADGVPWFAMEFVDGLPIDRYCEERSIRQRIELFRRVCTAVQYAHRNLVVHRDLKPANILVTAAGDVKLLDFGIAKLLSDGSASLTLTGERLMTPLYASPEQIRGEGITTGSDVYALGVLLYQLLTGQYPYRVTTTEPYEVARVILEQDSSPPSRVVAPKLARQLRGDLDVIVATAMRKDVAQRYGSAEQLEADISRHLAGMPLTARAESPVSRARKFVRRHRVAVAATSTILALVLAFAGTATVQALRIRAQAARIAAERDRAEQVSAFLAGLFRTTDPYLSAQGNLSARDILDSGAARIDRELATQPLLRSEMMLEMGRAYFGLGMRDRARRFIEISLAIRRRASPEELLQIARTLEVLGAVLKEQGDLEGAEHRFTEALALRRAAPQSTNRELARAVVGLGTVLHSAGELGRADSVLREAIRLDESESADNVLHLAESLEASAAVSRSLEDFPRADSLYRRALRLRDAPGVPPDAAAARSMAQLAATARDAGTNATGDSLFRAALTIERRLLGVDHPDVIADEVEHARLLHQMGRFAGAESLYIRALSTARAKLSPTHQLTATILLGLAALELERRAAPRAERLAREGLAIRRSSLAPWHPSVAEAEQVLGDALLARQQMVEAERYLLPSHESLRATFGNGDSRTLASLDRLILLYDAWRQPTAVAHYRAIRSATGSEASRDVSRPVMAESRITPPFAVVLPFQLAPTAASLSDFRNWLHDLLSDRVLRFRVPKKDNEHWALAGSLRGDAHRLTVEARIVGRLRGVRAQWTLVAAADSLPQLADRLVVHMLATLASETGDDSAAFERTSFAALREYLAGRAAWRRMVGPGAQQHLERSIALDSTFVFPRLWLAVSAEEQRTAIPADARWHFDAAWARRGEMGGAGNALLASRLGSRYPTLPPLRELISASEDLTGIAPNWAESWFALASNLSRFGPLVGVSRWEERTIAALERAVSLDSTHFHAIEGLVVYSAGIGDRERVRRYGDLYFARRRLPADSTAFLEWCVATVLGDNSRLGRVRARFETLPQQQLQRIGIFSEWHGIGTDDGLRAAEILRERTVAGAARRVAVQRAVVTLLNHGRADEANRLLDGFELGFGAQQGVGVREMQVYAALYWDGDSAAAVRAAQRLEMHVRGEKLGPGEVAGVPSAHCALAHWSIATGNHESARRSLAGVRRSRPVGGADASGLSVCAASIEALIARGTIDGFAALVRLDSLLQGVTTTRDQTITVGLLIAARLSESRGDAARALELIGRRTRWNHFLTTQLREEARLAAALGDGERAIRALQIFIALRKDAESRLQPDLARARMELARLEAAAVR